jgi:NitT/TauT family transport system substrate-binding protein
MLDKFHLTATGYNINYLPQYIAARHGFFANHGIEVIATIPTPWDGVLDALADGSADMALGGIWVPSMYRNRVQDYTVFAQIANRCPLAVLRRSSCQPFKVSHLEGSTILMKSIGGASCGLFTKMWLRENRVDIASIDFIQDLDGIMLGNLFQGGMGDFLVTDNLSAMAIASRDPNVSIAMEMVTQGEVPWSVYYCETSTITPKVLDMQTRFCVGLNRAIQWVNEADPDLYRAELSELFPKVHIDVAIKVVNSFRQNGMWTSAKIPREAFDRWQRGLADARFVDKPLPYESIMDNGPAEAAAAEASGLAMEREVV